MPFDDTKWDKTAIQGDLGAVAAATKFALDLISATLRKLKDGEPIGDLLDEITETSEWLGKIGEDLTGYTPDDN